MIVSNLKASPYEQAFHKNLVKTGLISQEYGKLYDELFEARQRGDYIEFVSFDKGQVQEWLDMASKFIIAIKKLTTI